ncbi:MAG: MFS transporter [Cellulosilyticaceae bacterium]
MLKNMQQNYRLTTVSCFVGIFVQAIITNLTAILFIPLMELYGLNYIHLGILVAVNFSAQVASDIIFSGVIDKVGYKKLVMPATVFAFAGLLLFGAAPYLFENVFVGILLATIVFAASSGLLEILLSPIINAIPGNDKGPAMSLMHSFYAWGQVVTIIVTTLLLLVLGRTKWQLILVMWAVVPVINFFMFLRAPFPPTIAEEHRQNMKDLILHPFYLFALAAIFFGAGTEVVMNQWSSAFMEKALSLPKVAGDLLGMCGFAVMLGVGRTVYGVYGQKLNVNKLLIGGSLAGIACYIVVALSPINGINLLACALCGLAASLLWPGTLIITADRFAMAGAWLFAILAAAGDVGAAFGPWLTGEVVNSMLVTQPEQIAIRLGILASVIFPIGAVACHIVLARMGRKQEN